MHKGLPWSGRLHIDRSWAAFRGFSASNTLHAHVAMQLCVGHALPPTVVDASGRAVHSRGIAIRPGVRHRLEPSPDITLVFIEPQTPLARKLMALLPRASIAPMPDELCNQIAAGVPLERLFGELMALAQPKAVLDGRLSTALAVLVETTANDGVAQAARAAGISPSRLRALAHAELGVPLAPWVMWRKLERAGAAIMAGSGLAEAALAGGFADQAHFSRAMRRVFGITPGELADLAKAQLPQANHTRLTGR